MKLLLLLAFIAEIQAVPEQRTSSLSQGREIRIQRFNFENNGLGQFKYAFKQSDGQTREEQGELKTANSGDKFVAVKGSYSWEGLDDVTYTVNYVADDNGFQPTIEEGPGGAVPDAVVASLLGSG